MSDPWNGFKLNTSTAKDLNILMTEGPSNPILPPTIDRTVRIPGRNGALYFGADLGPRVISIPCAFVYADTAEELETHANALADFLVDSDRKPKELTLTFEAAPDVDYKVRLSGHTELTRTVFDGQFTLVFIAFEEPEGEEE